MTKAGPCRSGFSIPECLVSATVLALVIVNGTQLFLSSTQTSHTSSSRDAVSTLVSEDVESLRNLLQNYHCRQGICAEDQSKRSYPISYLDPTDAIDVQEFSNLCMNKRLVSSFLDEAGFSEVPTSLVWPVDSSPLLKTILIKRILTPSSDSHHLNVSYKSSDNSYVNFEASMVLTPAAASWCP